MEWGQKAHTFSVVQSSVRVDVIEMPKFTVAELKEMQQQAGDDDSSASIEIEAPPTDDDFIVKKKKVKFADLMKRLSQKKLEAKPKDKKRKKRKKGTKFGKMSGALKNLVISGNKLKKGTSIVGNNAGISDGIFSNYLQRLPDIVRVNWKLPSYLMDKGLRCRVQIFLNEDGMVLQSRVIETSGEKEFDARALKAIKLSEPFPKIDDTISSRTVRGDIVLGFPL